jgi:hypothetical protein
MAMPPDWEVLAGRGPILGPMLRLGPRAIPVSEIRGFLASADIETDKKPAFLAVGVFALIAFLFLIVVFDLGWRARFLAGAAVFGGIALSALHDLAWLTTSGLYRVEVLTTGATIRFTTVDANEHARLLEALAAIVERNSAPATLSHVADEMRAALSPAPEEVRAAPSAVA